MITISNYTEYVNRVNEAKYHNYKYWVRQEPVITDEQFDELYFAIQQYEEAHPDMVLPDSPTRVVGTEGGKHTIPHRIPMLSTQKVKTVADVKKWMANATKTATRAVQNIYHDPSHRNAEMFSVEWKYDGTSCSLVYQDGLLIEASTRGDTKAGLGQDILCHIKQCKGIPRSLVYPTCPEDIAARIGAGIPGRVEVRGEIIIYEDEFHENLRDVYPDPRTAAASILNTDRPTEYDQFLTFKAWQFITDGSTVPSPLRIGEKASVTSQYWSLMTLSDYGFCVDQPMLIKADRIEEFIEYFTRIRSDIGFPTDGIVIKLDNKRLWDFMGRTEHHPKYLLAYKFQPKGAETTIHSIEITVGDTGKRTPVAYFDPVTINGKTYCKASLGSEAVMQKKGIAVGSRVEVVIANDVIPKVERVIS